MALSFFEIWNNYRESIENLTCRCDADNEIDSQSAFSRFFGQAFTWVCIIAVHMKSNRLVIFISIPFVNSVLLSMPTSVFRINNGYSVSLHYLLAKVVLASDKLHNRVRLHGSRNSVILDCREPSGQYWCWSSVTTRAGKQKMILALSFFANFSYRIKYFFISDQYLMLGHASANQDPQWHQSLCFDFWWMLW